MDATESGFKAMLMWMQAAQERVPANRRKEMLLAVALKAFAERGYRGTSMDQIAESAGITKPVIYRHFRSKRELYLSLIERLSLKLVGHVTAAVSTVSNPHEQVVIAFRSYFDFVQKNKQAFRLLFSSTESNDPKLREGMFIVRRHIVDALAPRIDVDLSPEHRSLLAYCLVSLAEGIGRLWQSGLSDLATLRYKDVRNLADDVAELAWFGLRGIQPDLDKTSHTIIET